MNVIQDLKADRKEAIVNPIPIKLEGSLELASTKIVQLPRSELPQNVAFEATTRSTSLLFDFLLRSSESPAAVFCPRRRERADVAVSSHQTLIVALSSLETDRLAQKKTLALACVPALALGSHSAEVKLEMSILWGAAAAWVLQGGLRVPVLP
jgi:hypothetical protein